MNIFARRPTPSQMAAHRARQQFYRGMEQAAAKLRSETPAEPNLVHDPSLECAWLAAKDARSRKRIAEQANDPPFIVSTVADAIAVAIRHSSTDELQITKADIYGDRRLNRIVRARQSAMWMMNRLGMSYGEIAEEMDGRCLDTARAGVVKMNLMIATSFAWLREVMFLKA